MPRCPWIASTRLWLSGLMLASLALFCILATVQFIYGRTWAWWAALTITLAVGGFGVYSFWSAFYSRDPFLQSEGVFVLFIGLCSILPALTSAILLNLPKVRRHYSSPAS